MKLIKGMVILFGCLFAGDILSHYVPVGLPGNIFGMIILFVLLASGALKLDDVNEAGSLFLDNLVLLFVPLGVGIMRYFGLLSQQILQLIVIGFAGYLISFALSGKVIDLLTKYKKNNAG